MAGFMSRLKSYDFPGEQKAHADLYNGMLVGLAVSGTEFITAATVADANTTFSVVEKDYNLGDEMENATLGTQAKGIRVRVEQIDPAKAYYLVENAEPRYELNFAPTYDTNEQKTAQGQYVRMHRIEEGEEFVTNFWVGASMPAVGTSLSVLAGGKIG